MKTIRIISGTIISTYFHLIERNLSHDFPCAQLVSTASPEQINGGFILRIRNKLRTISCQLL